MQTIVIPVSDKRPEDNILDLVNLFTEEFGDEIIRVSNALVVETDNPNIAAVFRKIAENTGSFIAKVANTKKDVQAVCIDCGDPVSKPGKRCKRCANKFYKKQKPKKPALLEFVVANTKKDVQAVCIDCGDPVSKPGKRCKRCANKFYKKQKPKKPALLEFVTETEPSEGAGNGIGE